MPWDDASSYSYTSVHTAQDWAWEFIRRDERYKAEWEKLINRPARQPLWPLLEVDGDISPYGDTEARLGVDLADNHNIETFGILDKGAWKWGLKYYQHPAAKKLVASNPYKIMSHLRRDTVSVEIDRDVSIFPEDHTLTVIFDLLKPMKPQLDEAAAIAKEYQENLNKRHPKMAATRSQKVNQQDRHRWTIYLRCIDAKAAGAKKKDAARKIMGGAEQGASVKWDDTLKQIKELAATNYRHLMF